jgi:hypothetical protein
MLIAEEARVPSFDLELPHMITDQKRTRWIEAIHDPEGEGWGVEGG